MIAETIEIARTKIVAAGFHTTVFLVGHQQEGRVVDVAVDELPSRSRVAEDMVEAAPQPMIAIGPFRPVTALRFFRHFHETMTDEQLKRGIRRIVVEVASNDDAGLG